MMVSKLDAAKRQLETSIHLYFSYGDPVSVHTLAAAAYNVIRDLNEKRGGEKMLKDMWQLLDTQDAALFRKHINEAENFLKHADRDPDSLLELSPQWTEVILLEASTRYCVLTDEQPAVLQLFINWFVVRHPNVFRESPEVAGGKMRVRELFSCLSHIVVMQTLFPRGYPGAKGLCKDLLTNELCLSFSTKADRKLS